MEFALKVACGVFHIRNSIKQTDKKAKRNYFLYWAEKTYSVQQWAQNGAKVKSKKWAHIHEYEPTFFPQVTEVFFSWLKRFFVRIV